MNIVVISGLSGAGKSTAASAFEDIGYFTVENVPVEFFSPIIEKLKDQGIDKLALVIDIRSVRGKPSLVKQFLYEIELIKQKYDVEVLFLAADRNVLIERFALTRRLHPLSKGNDFSIDDLLRKEEEILSPIKAISRVIDTTNFSVRKLRSYIIQLFSTEGLIFILESFGFKFGVPRDVDMIFDARILDNPFYDEKLRSLSGIDKAVREFLTKDEYTGWFVQHIVRLILISASRYMNMGKKVVLVGIGCSGGRHRSVFIADELGRILRSMGYETIVVHRDKDREDTVI
ncbi:MAG TPA: RNase adapter RapZ [Candidatus Nanopusillus sp.]|nr:RNase adapter RapZ [Candidatus Nanopusillus sp.]